MLEAISPIKWASCKKHDLASKKTQFSPTNHFVDNNNCSDTSPGTKCLTYMLHNQDFDRLGGQK